MPTPDAPQKLKGGFGTGLILATVSYVLWGILPAYFVLLAPAGAFEIVAWRILLSLIFCAVLLTVARGWGRLLALLRNRRVMLTLGLAGVFILVNWLTYIGATLSGHVVEASLGYFINPIVTVLLGVIVLREKLRPLQWAAIAVSAIAVLVLAINYGAVPWIALVLAFSFGIYGFIKKRVGGTVDALGGLTIETLWLAPLAAAQLIALAVTGGMVFGTVSGWHTTAILVAGVVTAVPLLMFAGAARRLPLVYIGLTQYLAPILQFLIGVFLFKEDMPAARWIGFAIVWVALILLTIDMIDSSRGSRRALPEPV